MYDSEVVNFKIGDIKSGDISTGHRFLAPREFKVSNLKSYLDKSLKRYVIVDRKEREKIILKGAKSLASSVKGSLIMDEGLLETTVSMTEYPFPILGGFEKKYLKLPKELLIEVIKKHQKCFTIADTKGNLLPYFVVVSNNRSTKPKLVRKGYEKVVRARFADAEYFYANDRSEPLEHYNSKLSKVVWQDKLGTLAEKVDRVKLLAAYIAELLDPSLKESAVRAAHLSKADLMTQVVYEFPELQGIMGRDYAGSSKEEREVSEALFEQYLPRFAGDKLPSTKIGAILNVADKIDSIVGCFGVGLIPSGSEDPLALRRQSLAVMNIIMKNKWDFSLSNIIIRAIECYGAKLTRNSDEIQRDIRGFFISRLKNQLTAGGVEYDVIDGVFAASFDHLTDDIEKVKAVASLKKEPYFESLAVTFNRVGNILKGVDSLPEVSPQLFRDDAEKALYRSLINVENKVSSLYNRGEYKGALKEVVAVRETVDLFFDGVMVMDKEPTVRDNRLSLLKRVSSLFSGIADFSKLVVK
ncbi:MAG: glycine--tRNA ligase subunit beta [Nitrospinota bacterium]